MIIKTYLTLNQAINISYDPSNSQPNHNNLHTFRLLPKHALQNRRRRELMAEQKPIPPHLMEGEDDGMYHAPAHQRRRMYPMMASFDIPRKASAKMMECVKDVFASNCLFICCMVS